MLPPFAGWPTQFVIPGGAGRIWFVRDATICVQIAPALGDVPMAKNYVAAIRALRAMHRDAIVGAGGLRLVQDFRSLRSVDKDAREYLNHAARLDFRPEDIAFNKVAIREDLVLVRIALFVHAMASTRLGLPRVESVSDLRAEAERLGLAPPVPGADEQRAFDAMAAELKDA